MEHPPVHRSELDALRTEVEGMLRSAPTGADVRAAVAEAMREALEPIRAKLLTLDAQVRSHRAPTAADIVRAVRPEIAKQLRAAIEGAALGTGEAIKEVRDSLRRETAGTAAQASADARLARESAAGPVEGAVAVLRDIGYALDCRHTPEAARASKAVAKAAIATLEASLASLPSRPRYEGTPGEVLAAHVATRGFDFSFRNVSRRIRQAKSEAARSFAEARSIVQRQRDAAVQLEQVAEHIATGSTLPSSVPDVLRSAALTARRGVTAGVASAGLADELRQRAVSSMSACSEADAKLDQLAEVLRIAQSGAAARTFSRLAPEADGVERRLFLRTAEICDRTHHARRNNYAQRHAPTAIARRSLIATL